MTTYEIKTETGEILAQDLTTAMIDAWWSANERTWFGLRVDGRSIIVSPAQQ